MPSLVEILCCLDEEIGLVCWQLVHDTYATEIVGIQPTCELSLFSFKLNNLLDISSICNMLRAFERNQSLKKQLSDVLETNSLTLMTMLKFFS